MKKLLLFLTLVISATVDNNSAAQCVISDSKVRSIQVDPSNCEFTFDLSWTQEVNNGNKFAYIHIWTQPAYHTPAVNWADMYRNPVAYPKNADLVNTLATFVIDENSSANPLIGTVYHPDETYVLPQQTDLSVVKVHLNNTLIERMTLQNIKLKLPSCTGAQTILYDIWTSQAANGRNVSCAVQGANLVINEIKPIGIISCVMPRKFQVFIQNAGPAVDSVKYDVHLDYAPFGIINLTDTVVFQSEYIVLPANGSYLSPVTEYFPYSNRLPSANMPLIIEVTVPLRPNTTTARMENGCGPLSVKFNFFTVQRKKDNIVLNWQTVTEQNNRGFEIERRLFGNEYKTIAFVPSKARNGNSNILINYSYVEIENLMGAGEVYYRIKQIDLDGNCSYSEIKVLKNNPEKIDILVYPNPSTGMAKVVFPKGIGPVEMILVDGAGKEIKRWYGVFEILQLDNLNAGYYMLRIFIKETGDVQLKRLVVLSQK
jgi:hypothetical protein